MRQGNRTVVLPAANQSALFEDWIIRLTPKLPPKVTTRTYASPDHMENAFKSDLNVVAGLSVDFSSYPEFVEYDIRLPSNLLVSPIPSRSRSPTEYSYGNLLGGADNFANSGFNALQVLAEETLGNTLAADMGAFEDSGSVVRSSQQSPSDPSFQLFVSTARTPYAVLKDFKWVSQSPIFLTLCFSSMVGIIALGITMERLSGKIAYWRVMGMSSKAYWFGHAVSASISLLPTMVLVVAWTGIIGFWGSSYLHAIANIVLFVACCVPVSLLIGASALNDGIASLLNALFFILPLLASATVSAPQPVRLAMCILPAFNFLFGSVELLKRRAMSIMGPTEAIPITIGDIPDMDPLITIGFFFIDLVLFWGLAILVMYLRHRGATTIPPASSKLADEAASKAHAVSSESDANGLIDLDSPVSDNEDSSSSSLKLGSDSPMREHHSTSNLVLSASNLFIQSSNPDQPKLLVDRLQIEPGIYALIGNGKSELMAALSDMARPNTGSLHILGYEMYRHKAELRGHISICPKADLLCDTLSGVSHIELVARLSKAHPFDDVSFRVRSVIEELGLSGIAQQSVEFYSAGEKRLLMLACALVVPARIVLLDEVSSGMSFDQRKIVWKALMKRRTVDNTTFVVTSEHMDEVEMIAERIGIMHNGALIREGSLDYLLQQIDSIPRPSAGIISSSSLPSSTLELAEDIAEEADFEAKNPKNGLNMQHGLKSYFDTLKVSLDPSVQIHEERSSASTRILNGLNSANCSRNASQRQQFSQLWRQQIMSKLRNRKVIVNGFVLVPIILTMIAMATSRSASVSLSAIPTVAGKLQASTIPISINNITGINSSLPVDGPTSFSNLILRPWLGENLTVDQYSGSTSFNGALWRANGLHYPEGGLFIQDTASSAFSYSVAYNATEVYSSTRLINWVNNAAFSYYMTSMQGIQAPPSNISSPFLRVRSVPFAPRDTTGVLAMPGIHNVIASVTPNTMNCSFQIVLAMAIMTCILGMQMVKERTSGFWDMLRRSGMSLPAYWSHTILFNLTRFTFGALLIVATSANFNYGFLKGPVMLIWIISIILTTWSFMMLAFMVYGKATEKTIIRNVMHFHVLLSVLPGMFSQLGPAAFSKAGWLHGVGYGLQYVYYIYPTAIFPEMVPRMASIFAESGFKEASFHDLFSGPHSLTLPMTFILLHIALIFTIFVIKEALTSWVRREKEIHPDIPNFHSPENSAPIVSGGLPAYDPAVLRSPALSLNSSAGEPMSDLESGSIAGLDIMGVETRALRCRFPNMPRAALESVTLEVPYGSSYALVGPPNSGKTAVLRLLSGLDASTGGEMYLAGRVVAGTNKTQLFTDSRLCTVLEPNCFNRFMTPREAIKIFLSMRNDLAELDLDARATQILERALLTESADTMLETLDLSVKQVLVAAIATLSFNEVILLDEPTKGCDYATRQMILSLLSEAIQEKSSAIVITSNTLDDAARLCDRVGLIINGQIACQGRISELDAACSGYELRVSFCDRNSEAFGVSGYLDTYELLAQIEGGILRTGADGFIRVDLEESCAKGMASVSSYDLPSAINLEECRQQLSQAVADGKILSYKLIKTNLAAVASRLANQQLDDYSRVPIENSCCNLCK